MKILELNDSPIHVSGWGAAPGPLRYSNAEVCDIFGFDPGVADQVERKIGTRYRHACVDLRARRQLVTAADMAHEAARAALARASLTVADLDAIIAVGTVPDHYCPPNSVRLQKLLGIEAGLTFDLYGGCGLWGQATFLAAQLLQAGTVETVLVVATEPLTRQLWTMRRTWEVLAFGDGAAAMIFSRRHRGPFHLRRCGAGTAGNLGSDSKPIWDEIMIVPALGPVLPPVLASDNRFDPALPPSGYPDEYRTSHRADLAARWGAHYMATAVEQITAGIDRGDIYLCPHQPSRVVLDAVQAKLALDPAQIAVINPDFGNLSSASSPMAFCQHFEDGPDRYPWTVLAPVGTGLTYGAALLERVGSKHATR